MYLCLYMAVCCIGVCDIFVLQRVNIVAFSLYKDIFSVSNKKHLGKSTRRDGGVTFISTEKSKKQ